MRKTSYKDVCAVTLSALSVEGSEPFYQSKGAYEFDRVDNHITEKDAIIESRNNYESKVVDCKDHVISRYKDMIRM